MIEVEHRDDIQPVCPHCGVQIRTVWYQDLRTLLGKRFIYFCSGCRKVLGISHRKGFWMG